MQAGQPGTTAFGQSDGKGRSGSASMRLQPSPLDEVWSSVDISDDMLRVASEAVVGRVDIEELLGDTLPKYLADEVSAQSPQHKAGGFAGTAVYTQITASYITHNALAQSLVTRAASAT